MVSGQGGSFTPVSQGPLLPGVPDPETSEHRGPAGRFQGASPREPRGTLRSHPLLPPTALPRGGRLPRAAVSRHHSAAPLLCPPTGVSPPRGQFCPGLQWRVQNGGEGPLVNKALKGRLPSGDKGSASGPGARPLSPPPPLRSKAALRRRP